MGSEMCIRDRPATRLRWIKAAVGKQVKLIAVGDVVYFLSLIHI